MGESPRSPSGSANGPAVTTPRYARPSVRLLMRTSDCAGAACSLSFGTSTVTVRSALPGRSKSVLPTAPASSGCGTTGPPARALSAASRSRNAVPFLLSIMMTAPL